MSLSFVFKFPSEACAYACMAALRVAAEVYDKDADTAGRSDINTEARERIVRQFRDQAEAARNTANNLEAQL